MIDIQDVEIEFRFKVPIDNNMSDEELKEEVKEQLVNYTTDEYRLQNLTELSFEETDETHHHFRAIFEDEG